MKRLAVLGLSLMLCLFALAGCGSSSDTKKTDEELTGTWTTSETEGSKTIDKSLTFEDGGSFTLTIEEELPSEGSTAKSEGTYTVKDNTITFIVEEVEVISRLDGGSNSESATGSTEAEVQDQITFTCDYTLSGSSLTLTENSSTDNGDISSTGLDLSKPLTLEKEASK